MKKSITEQDVLDALDQVEEPELHASLVSLHMVQNIVVKGDAVSFDLILTTPACPLKTADRGFSTRGCHGFGC